MVGSKLLWLALTAALSVLAVLAGSWASAALAAVLILLPLGALLLNFVAAKHVRCALSAPVNLRKNSAGQAQLRLENDTWIPIGRVICRVRVQNQLTGEQQQFRAACALPPRAVRTIPLGICSAYCGRLRMSVTAVRLYDPFALFGVCVQTKTHGALSVLPDTFEQQLSVRSAFAPQSDEEIYDPNRPGYDLSEAFQLREYVPGDSPRQIHWKLSQKFDRLIVRDPSLPVRNDLAVFWERSQPQDTPAMADAQAEVAASLCRNLLSMGQAFTLYWNDPAQSRILSYPMRELDDLVGVLPRLLSTPSGDGTCGLSQLMQLRDGAEMAHIVYITSNSEISDAIAWQGQMTVLCCADATPVGAVRFDPAQYAEQLQQLTI